MKTSWRRLSAAAIVGAGVPAAMLLVGVMACGPDFEPEVFVPEHQPESPKLYADGHLGVVRPGYFHAELVVAYRYLSGAKLSDPEKAAYLSTNEATNDPYVWNQQRDAAATAAMNAWQLARAEVAPGAESPSVSENMTVVQSAGIASLDEVMLNCTDGAFITAAKTLRARAQTWGVNSTELKEWLQGQDAVFGNCTGPAQTPDPPQPSWSLLLRQDRAYQIAAANFYAHKFQDAVADFVAIGKDKASPWSRWGEYLAARAEVRNAADLGTTTAFDKSGLQAAQVRLLKIQSETRDAEVRHAAQTELNLVEVRLDPAKRLDEAGAALAFPDPDFAQDLADLDFLMDQNVMGTSDIARWIKAIQSSGPNPLVVSAWRAQHSAPWLVAAMAEAKNGDAAGAELAAAASAVKRDSPAYATVNYYRVGWLLGAKKKAEARALANTVVAGMGPETMASTKNAFLAERIQTARSLAEFLADAPRAMIESGSSAAQMMQCSDQAAGGKCAVKIPPMQFDADAATSINVLMPLTMWEQAAETDTLPKNLRDAVAWAAWMRALGLGDAAAVKKMASQLPPEVEKTVGDGDGFSAVLALLRNPGMRPYLDQGVQRSATYASMDEFRDNWWCGRWIDGGGNGGLDPNDSNAAQAQPQADFLTASEKKQAADEAAKLNALPDGAVWMGRQVIAYLKAHPEDKDAAEALGLTVRATHLSCSGESDTNGQKAVSKEAFEMLHRLYPKSEWALRTKYYY